MARLILRSHHQISAPNSKPAILPYPVGKAGLCECGLPCSLLSPASPLSLISTVPPTSQPTTLPAISRTQPARSRQCFHRQCPSLLLCLLAASSLSFKVQHTRVTTLRSPHPAWHIHFPCPMCTCSFGPGRSASPVYITGDRHLQPLHQTVNI